MINFVMSVASNVSSLSKRANYTLMHDVIRLLKRSSLYSTCKLISSYHVMKLTLTHLASFYWAIVSVCHCRLFLRVEQLRLAPNLRPWSRRISRNGPQNYFLYEMQQQPV